MRVQVTYEDGEVAEYRVKPRHLLRFEEQFPSQKAAETVKGAYTLAHLASEASDPLKTWLGKVEDITTLRDEGDAGAEEASESEAGEPDPTE